MMTGIWPMAALTVAASATVAWAVIRHVPSQGRAYVPLLMVGLFSSAGVNLLVKGPLATGVVTLTNTSRGLTAASPVWLLVFAWLLAPITEEAAKAAPLLVPRLRRRLHTSEDALWSAMALGIFARPGSTSKKSRRTAPPRRTTSTHNRRLVRSLSINSGRIVIWNPNGWLSLK